MEDREKVRKEEGNWWINGLGGELGVRKELGCSKCFPQRTNGRTMLLANSDGYPWLTFMFAILLYGVELFQL